MKRDYILELLKGEYLIMLLPKVVVVYYSIYYNWLHTKDMKNARIESNQCLKRYIYY